MIGGFGRMSTTGAMGRFVGPSQHKKNVDKLHKLESSLVKAKSAVKAQKGIMMRAMFSPEGYKKALAHLHTLEKKVSTLNREIKDLKHLMTVA